MEEFISDPLRPLGKFDTGAMATGVPGLPQGFEWRGESFQIEAQLDAWKQSAPTPGGQVYLRRHCYRLRMSDGSVWTVYFTRQTPRCGSPKRRWFLYSIDRG
jgi:hypothetical protein